MSLTVFIRPPVTVKKKSQEEVELTELTIDKIIDVPAERCVYVWTMGERILLEELSYNNYDMPNEWTKSDVIDAVKKHLGIPH